MGASSARPSSSSATSAANALEWARWSVSEPGPTNPSRWAWVSDSRSSSSRSSGPERTDDPLRATMWPSGRFGLFRLAELLVSAEVLVGRLVVLVGSVGLVGAARRRRRFFTGGPDDDVAAGLVALRAGRHPVELVDGVVHDLAIGRVHGLEGLRHSRLDDLSRDLLGELGQGGGATSPIATHVDVDPAAGVLAAALHDRARQLLQGIDRRSPRSDQVADAVAVDRHLDVLVVDGARHGGGEAEALDHTSHELLCQSGLGFDTHLFLLRPTLSWT